MAPRRAHRDGRSATVEAKPWKTRRNPLTSRRAALLKTVFTAALLHGGFTVSLPVVILRWSEGIPLLAMNIGQFRWLGAALVGFGVYIYVWSAARLLRTHTSAIPGVKPTVLLTDGWYARTRHPLLLGVVTILLGEAIFFSSLALVGYALTYWLWLTVFVVLKEEPDLRQAFGAQFDVYCGDVPRWIPRF